MEKNTQEQYIQVCIQVNKKNAQYAFHYAFRVLTMIAPLPCMTENSAPAWIGLED